MRIPMVMIAVFSIAVAHAAANGPPVGNEPEEEAFLREREEYHAAVAEIDRLIKAGQLKEAEATVERHEPKYARKWSVGRMGYGTRMDIGRAYLDRGNRSEALRLFRAAKPGGGCGNCMASQHVHRNISIAGIHESRLNYPAAFFSYLGALPATALGDGLLRVAAGLSYSGTITLIPVLAGGYFWRRRRTRNGQRGTIS